MLFWEEDVEAHALRRRVGRSRRSPVILDMIEKRCVRWYGTYCADSNEANAPWMNRSLALAVRDAGRPDTNWAAFWAARARAAPGAMGRGRCFGSGC